MILDLFFVDFIFNIFCRDMKIDIVFILREIGIFGLRIYMEGGMLNVE